MNQELGDKWGGWDYEEIQPTADHYSYTRLYLLSTSNYKDLTTFPWLLTSAEIPIIVKLAKLDLQKGTTIPRLVHVCCCWFPVKGVLEEMIELGKKSEREQTIVQNIFEYGDQDCLIRIFHLANVYTNATKF